jgi:nitric oxide reductase subunit B
VEHAVTYASQRVAYPCFVVALLLIGLQLVVGPYLAFSYFSTVPQGVVDVFPFASARAMHTNLLVLWRLPGFMGATYYAIPEETQSELAWPRLAIAQLVLLSGTGVTALVGFLSGWTQGRPLLEIPTSLDVLVVVGAPAFLANVAVTIFRARRYTATQGTLLAGLVFLALMYLFGVPFYENLSVDCVLQSYLERYQGQAYMVAQDPIRFWMLAVFLHGLLVFAGAVLVIRHLLTLRPAPVRA